MGNASAAQSSLQVGDKYQGEYDTLLFRDTAMDLIEQHASLEAQSAQSGGSGSYVDIAGGACRRLTAQNHTALTLPTRATRAGAGPRM